MDPTFTPFSVGGYRCIQHLSAGRGGDLFAAIHRPSGQLRALRRLAGEVLEDRDMADAVLRALERVQQLSHPNILRVHEVLREGPQIYVATDYVQGVNLTAVLRNIRQTAPFSPPVATFVASQICQALDRAHHLRLPEDGRPAPLVHGALWPPNVLVSAKGEVIVSDFGWWVIPTGMHGGEGALSIRTQFSYRSPEHVNGSTLTSASDIFCVGVLLHEMLTGRAPFLGSSLMETLEMVENAMVGDLADIPPPLRPVLKRCLDKEPARRYADPAALISDLSVAVPGSGSRGVRQELMRLVEPLVKPREGLQPPLVPVAIPSEEFSLAEVEQEEGDTRRTAGRQLKPPASIKPPATAKPPSGLPEPLAALEPAAPLSPLPGLREDLDEPTGINPTGVTEALVALSKDATDPGALDQLFDSSEEEEPTRIDPIIPGITGPEEETADGPTNVLAPVDQNVLWEGPEDDTQTEGVEQPKRRREEVTQPQPVIYPPLKPAARPPRDADVSGSPPRSQSGEFSGDEEPTFQTPQGVLDSITPPVAMPSISVPAPDSEEEPTSPATPEGVGGAQPLPPPITEDDEDEPTIQASPPPGPVGLTPVGEPTPQGAKAAALASTVPWPALEETYGRPSPPPVERPRPASPSPPPAASPRSEEISVDQLRREALARQQPSPLEFSYSADGPPELRSSDPAGRQDEQAELSFEPETASDVQTFDGDSGVATYDPASGVAPFGGMGGVASYDADSGVASFDADSGVASFSHEWSQAPRRPRFTAAHLLLLVAIVVFLIAVGLLIRRLVMQSSSRRSRATIQRLADAGQLVPKATALEADAGPPRTKTPKARPKDAGPRAPAPVHSSGQHLKDLLQGSRLQPGMLRVTTTPPAVVYLNGKAIGLSPQTAKVRPGDRVALALVATRYELHYQMVDVPLSKGLPLQITLREATYPRTDSRKRGWLTVRCSKRDRRRVAINGQDSGFSCPGPVTFRVKPGRYKVGFVSLLTGKAKVKTAKVRWGRRTNIWAPRR